jgi:hypothetical protein
MKLLPTLCCTALALGSALYAQTAADHMTVHFSTPVIVGETKLPAGDCDIQVMPGTSDSIILVLRSQNGPSTLAVATRLSEGNMDAEDSTGVVLHRRGDDLRLYRVLIANRNGYQLFNAE